MSKKFLAVLILGVLSTGSSVKAENAGHGGGEGITAQYSEVSNKALMAVKLICRGLENPDPDTVKVCSYVPSAEIAISKMKVEPRSRDTVLGSDGKPRDGGNDNYQTVFLDIDRWTDKQNEINPNKIWDARIKQVQLSLHEPLVLVSGEKNDTYTTSNKFIDMLSEYNFSLNSLVGKPSVNIGNTNIFKAHGTQGTCSFREPLFNEEGIRKEAIDVAQDLCYEAQFDVCEVLHTDVIKIAMSCARPTGYTVQATIRGIHTH